MCFSDVVGRQTKVLISNRCPLPENHVEEARSLNIPAREERTKLEGMGGIASSASVKEKNNDRVS